jgi:hypothetical protein
VSEDRWGPWDALIDRCERLGRLRSLQALTHAFFGRDHPLIRALFRAESQLPDDLRAASEELDRVPSRDRRKILSTYAALLAYRAQESAANARAVEIETKKRRKEDAVADRPA